MTSIEEHLFRNTRSGLPPKNGNGRTRYVTAAVTLAVVLAGMLMALYFLEKIKQSRFSEAPQSQELSSEEKQRIIDELNAAGDPTPLASEEKQRIIDELNAKGDPTPLSPEEKSQILQSLNEMAR